MTRPRELKPPTLVPFSATPAGELPSVRTWANPSVWTNPMLTALEQGVRGGRWHTLIDKVFAEIVDAKTEIFDFLGYRFKGAVRLPRPKSSDKLKDTIRAKTKRTNGDSLPFIINQVNLTLRGWFTYFRHCNRTVFQDLDHWIRMRIRSILRKRSGRRGRGRGKDHVLWPNKFFEEIGLFNLKTAHISYSQSCFR